MEPDCRVRWVAAVLAGRGGRECMSGLPLGRRGGAMGRFRWIVELEETRVWVFRLPAWQKSSESDGTGHGASGWGCGSTCRWALARFAASLCPRV